MLRTVFLLKEKKKKKGVNTILVLTFWFHSQFGPYILITVNLVSITNSLTENTYVANGEHS